MFAFIRSKLARPSSEIVRVGAHAFPSTTCC